LCSTVSPLFPLMCAGQPPRQVTTLNQVSHLLSLPAAPGQPLKQVNPLTHALHSLGLQQVSPLA